MSYVNPFRAPGRWFRGNTHTHTTLSDGRLSLPDRVAAYRAAGYDFLAITDHRRVSDVAGYGDPQFLVIPGSELHPANPYGGEVYHLVALGVREPVATEDRHPNEVIAAVRAQGGHAVICHPYWCGHALPDLMPLEGCFAVEVYNTTCAGIGKALSESHWDDLLDRKGPLLGIAADDAHGTEHDCFKAWVMVKSPSLTAESILAALVSGAFYSTTGPTIEDLSVTPDDAPGAHRVAVRCSPARSIVFKAQCAYGRAHYAADGAPLTAAEYRVDGRQKYVRVEITDDQGRRAWSNPIFF